MEKEVSRGCLPPPPFGVLPLFSASHKTEGEFSPLLEIGELIVLYRYSSTMVLTEANAWESVMMSWGGAINELSDALSPSGVVQRAKNLYRVYGCERVKQIPHLAMLGAVQTSPAQPGGGKNGMTMKNGGT